MTTKAKFKPLKAAAVIKTIERAESDALQALELMGDIEAAELMGVSRNYVYDLRKKKKNLSVYQACKILSAWETWAGE